MPLLRRPKALLLKPRPATRGFVARWSYTLTVVAAAVVAILVGLLKSPLLPQLNNLVFDWYQRLDPRPWSPELPVRIVDIDDESLARIGQWPWPRSTVAEIVARLGRIGAAVVAIDIVFAEPDGSSPERVVEMLPPTPGRALLEQEISSRKSNDAVLAEALTATPSALGAILTQSGGASDYPAKYGIASAGDDPRPFLAHFTGASIPLPVLRSASRGLGALNWLPDRDQVVRRVPLVLALGERIVTSLTVEALRVAQGATTVLVRSSNASGQSAFGAHTGVNAIKVGALEIPTDPEAELRVRYSASEPRRFIPAWKIIAGNADPADIKNRIILLGTSAVGLRDQRATPVDVSVAGVEIHAQAIEQIITGAWLSRPDWLPGAELVLAVALAFALGMLLPRTSPLAGAIGVAGILGALIWTSRHQFSAHGLLVDPILPALSVATTYIACVVWLYRDEQRQRKFVREAFGRYVSPEVVERLAADPLKLNLGGETRLLTVMFCDIRGFTAIAERLDAQQLTQFMNEYLTPMTDTVLAHGGTIDKYIGDAIMAFWNAPVDDPDHARHAAQAALAMTRELDRLNARWRARAQAQGETHSDIKAGIGLAAGDCCVGNFGSARRFDYSALGDHVNTASRLEAATKIYPLEILASEATRDLSPDLAWLEVDSVRIRGKTQVTRIYTLTDDAIEPQNPAFAALAHVHDRMLAAYRCGEFASAAVLALEARDLASPRLYALYDIYLQRCRALERAQPADWTPVTDLAEA